MGHNPAMIEEPSADPETSMSGGKRLQARVLRAQSRAQELYERVPVQVRRNARRLFSALFLVVVGTVLYRQLEGTDWAEVWSSLPASPWFYLLFIARFFLQPTVEALCYTAVWGINIFRYYGVLLIKLVMNFSLAGGSGDLYFLVWAVRTLHLSYRKAFSGIKDVTLLSAAAANIVAVVVLGGYFFFGDLSFTETVDPSVLTIIIGVTLAAAVLSLFVILFRGKVLGVGTPTMWRIIGYHVARSGGNLVLLGLQWTVGLPGSVFSAWISFLVIELVVQRTPFIPAREFLFLSIALALADTVNAPQAQVTALFLADTTMRQLIIIPSLIAGFVWRTKPLPLPLDPGADEESA
jgi:hypothetical protein